MGSSLSGHKAKLTGRLPTNVDNKRPQVSPHPPTQRHRPQTIIVYVSCVCRVYRERVELVSVFCCNWFRARTQIYTILYYTILYMNELRGERNANCRFWFWSCDYKRFLPQRHGMSLDTTGRVERERERERPDSKHCHKDFKIDSNDNDFLSSSVCSPPPSLFLWVFWSECIHECTHIQF